MFFIIIGIQIIFYLINFFPLKYPEPYWTYDIFMTSDDYFIDSETSWPKYGFIVLLISFKLKIYS